MHECELTRIVLRDTTEEQFIYLREKDGARRVFPIVIGRFEARAIDRSVRKQAPPRPMTHDLLATVIEATGASLERVEITDLKEGTFFASLKVRKEGETVEVDSRPSDAIALAVRTGAPIFVSEEVLKEASEVPKS
jgi:bifunctional DNase/RNase